MIMEDPEIRTPGTLTLSVAAFTTTLVGDDLVFFFGHWSSHPATLNPNLSPPRPQPRPAERISPLAAFPTSHPSSAQKRQRELAAAAERWEEEEEAHPTGSSFRKMHRTHSRERGEGQAQTPDEAQVRVELG
jgi:hypothetical protein